MRWGEARARWILLVTVLGSSLGFIDATVVTIAVPDIGRTLGAGAGELTWVVNAYTLTLASFILLGGSLSDRYGRRRIYLTGVLWFAVASLACGLAPTGAALVAFRTLQGIGAALLTPGALAIIEASFDPASRSRAIGVWSGMAGISGALAPFVGGWLVQLAGWRAVFLINLPLAAVVLGAGVRHLPESRDPDAAPRLDLPGAVLCAMGLGAVTFGLTAWSATTFGAGVAVWLVAGAAALIGFVVVERRSRHPMVPLSIFSSRAFGAVNVITFLNYAAIAGVFFFLVVQLQVVSGYSPLASGLASLPATGFLVLLSGRVGALSMRTGPRVLMTAGPAVAALGLVLLSRIGPSAAYVTDVLPGVLLLGFGISLFVAPLTSVALGSAPERLAGVASGVNNAVARTASLLAIAALPLLSGLGGSLTDPAALGPAYGTAILVCAALMAGGGLLSLATMPVSYDAMRAAAGRRPPSGAAG